MEKLQERIRAFDQQVTFSSLGDFIASLDIEDIRYERQLHEPDYPGDYGRTILSMHPFECVLIHWPAGTESAVHLHEGLFGYVWVLEGELENVFYKHENQLLKEYSIERYGRGGLIPEPDGVIHKLRNHSKNERAVSLHFYYPAIESFEGMRIFSLEKGCIGQLSNTAKTASWREEEGHFKKIEQNAFEYISYDQVHEHKSHIIRYVIPKPKAARIRLMNAAYFSEQAAQYDFSDFNQPNRMLYTESIDQLIANSIASQGEMNKQLDIATGTGRRALHIRELSGLNYAITGLDISENMCHIAANRGIHTIHSDLTTDDPDLDGPFDAITFMYAFGHIASRAERLNILKKVSDSLSEQGCFYFDVFSLLNKNEWGPLALLAYQEKELGKWGYEEGDVFYQKRGLKELAFLHYFRESEIATLLEQSGLKISAIQYVGYAKRPGELVNGENEGNIFITARRK